MIESPEVPHAHTDAHAGRHWFDVVMAIAVLTMSAGSLYVALHTGSTMEQLVEQNQRLVQANSTPLLTFRHSNRVEGDPRLRFTVANVGAGPTRIVWLELRRSGKPYPAMRPLIETIAGAPLDALEIGTAPIAPLIVPAGEMITVFDWERPAANDPVLAVWDALDRERFHYEVEACYCSVLDQCWTATLDGSPAVPVDACDAGGRTILRG